VEAVPTAVRSFSEVLDRSVVYRILLYLRTHFAPSSLLHRRRPLSYCPYDHSSTLYILPASTYACFLPLASLATFYTLTIGLRNDRRSSNSIGDGDTMGRRVRSRCEGQYDGTKGPYRLLNDLDRLKINELL
jgi:hypothetical protein